MIRAIFSNNTQSFEERCEHCGEKIIDLHISDITSKSKSWSGVLRIRDKDNALKVIDKRQDRIAKESGSYIAKGLLNASVP